MNFVTHSDQSFLSEKARPWKIQVSSFFTQKIAEERAILDHKIGPLQRIVYPDEKLEQALAGKVVERSDFIGDKKNMPDPLSGGLIHKYPDRVLYLPTQKCLSHCAYCFRQELLTEPGEKHVKMMLEQAVLYVNKATQVKEVILSGGDPLVLSAGQLEHIMTSFKKERKDLKFRIHTKALTFQPKSIDEDKQVVFKKFNVRLVFHIVHPYEVCERVEEKIKECDQLGLHLYNQFPVLRGINDHEEVIARLLERLDAMRVRNLSIFFPDPVQHSASYRLPAKKLFELMKKVNQNYPSWVNATRFCQDTAHGKVRPEDLVEIDEKKCIVKYERAGRVIEVPDFPKAFYKESELKRLLWKD